MPSQLLKSGALALGLLLGAAATSQAQSGELLAHEFIRKDVFDAMTKSMQQSSEYAKLMGSLKNVPGQGYFTPEWLPGSVVKKAGAPETAAALRYNLAGQVVELRSGAADGDVQVLSPGELTRFTLGPATQLNSHYFEAHAYQNSQQSGGVDFFEALNTGIQLRFFLLHKLGVRPGASTSISSTGELRPDAFVKETRLFVQRPGQTRLQEFELTPKAVVKLFGSRAREVQEYAATKKWSYSNLQDVIWMTDYYNQLATAQK